MLSGEELCNDKLASMGVGQTEDIETLKQALAEENEKSEKYLANWQRAQADFVNYKRRAEQDKAEMLEFANSALILSLLPILDDMERAFASVPDHLRDCNWVDGIKLIYNKFKAILEAQGLAEIRAKGEKFDPRLHEAVMRQKGEEGIVIEEIQKGYKLKDRVIRPSMVIVGRESDEDEMEQIVQEEEQTWAEQ